MLSGTHEAEAALGDGYVISKLATRPQYLGWASARRRQILVFVRKAFVRPILELDGKDLHAH